MKSLEDSAVSRIVAEVEAATSADKYQKMAFIHSCSLDLQSHEVLSKLLNSIIDHGLIASLQHVFVLNFGNHIPDELQQMFRWQFFSHFFGSSHTLERYETAFYRPLVSDWRNFETWEADDARTATVV